MTKSNSSVVVAVLVATVLSGCGLDDSSEDGSETEPAEAVEVVTGAATKLYCGSACNNRLPNWVITSGALGGKGIQCSNSAVRVASGHPRTLDDRTSDTYMTVNVYYSTVCETLWATVTNSRAIGRTSCDIDNTRFITPLYNVGSNCPSAGTSITVRMVDDHSPTYGVAANISLVEQAYGETYQFWFNY